jgi:hypothetical protein
MVELGFNTESQKQLQFAQLIQLREMGVPVPDASLIEAATIQNKDKIIEMIQQQQQQAEQMQNAQVQATIQEQQARTQLAQSRSIADQGLGAERFSRIEENKALAEERKAAAEKDDMMSLLNFTKAIKEIESIDYVQLEKILSLKRMLDDAEAVSMRERESSPVQKGSVAVR